MRGIQAVASFAVLIGVILIMIGVGLDPLPAGIVLAALGLATAVAIQLRYWRA